MNSKRKHLIPKSLIQQNADVKYGYKSLIYGYDQEFDCLVIMIVIPQAQLIQCLVEL
jgi:hypothetical protein